VAEAPAEVRGTIDREVVDKKNRFSENIDKKEYDQLSE
jgi:hypothetical protein